MGKRSRRIGQGLGVSAIAGAAGRSIHKAIQRAAKSYGKEKGKGSRPFEGATATTDEKETKLLYRRKNKGQGKKAKRQIQFRRKVQNALRQELGSQVVHSYDMQLIQSTAGQQQWGSITLFGASGTAGIHDDLSNLFVKYMNWGVGYGFTNKLMVNSGYLDCTLEAYSSVAGVIAVVDVYTCVLKKNTPTGLATPELEMAAWEARDSLMPGTTVVAPAITTPFWTPFNSPSVTKQLTILSKRRLLLSSGKSMTLSMGGRMHRRLAYVDTTQHTFIPGLTKIMLFCVSGRQVNPAALTDVAQYPAVNLNVQWSRTYNFDVLQDNKSTTATEVAH